MGAPAQAAKGAKKAKNGEHHTHGVVVAVDHKTGQVAIKAHHPGKKKKAAAGAATAGNAGKAGSGHVHKFTVSANTKVFTMQQGMKKAASFTAVHKGSHVSIASKKHQADSIAIHKKKKKKAANQQ